MPRQHLFRLLLLLVLIAPLTAQAVTLGKIRVNSFLGQPLDAEIDLVGLSAGQHEDLRLRIANQDQFARLGIIYDAILADMRFAVVRSDGRWLVRLRTDNPVVEPFLDFPLLMTWRNGQLVRQYTLLLDPPRRINVSQITQRSAPVAAPAPVMRQPEPSTGDLYGPVQRGETLWPIAKRLKPANVTTRQMALALLRANPDAFINGNMNLLRAGARLTIPPRSLIDQIDQATARAEFAAQAQRHERTTTQVATSPRTEPPKISQPSGKAADGSVDKIPSEDDADDQTEARDAQLKIVTKRQAADPASNDTQDLQEQLLVTMEEIESNRLATGAIRARVEELETELIRMHQLVQLKNEQIAALQSELPTGEGTDKPPPGTAPAVEGRLDEQQRPTSDDPITAQRTDPRDALAEVAQPADGIQVETGIVPAADSTGGQAWYERYLWVIWAVLAFLGMTALLLAFRRPKEASDELPLPELPETQSASALSGAALSEAVASPQAPVAAEQAQDRDSGRTAADASTDDGISDTLLNDMLEESELQANKPPRSDADSEVNDADIASWLNELGSEAVPIRPTDAEERATSDDEDIPSILTELDDRLSTTAPTEPSPASSVQLDPLDDAGEDETFAMSLDLARAYLEIGDQEGASDMLKQALSVAHNPDHRRQIEELLQQID